MNTKTPIGQRVKEIPNYFIKRIDLFTYEVRSVNPKNQGEVKYMVFNSKNIGWNCTCPAYIYSKTPDNPTCKHIIRVQNMIKESAKRQARKAQKETEDFKSDMNFIMSFSKMEQKENSKVDLGDLFK